jgi:hypothetical protein
LRETLFAAMQTHLAFVAAQQNDIVKRLAAWGQGHLVFQFNPDESQRL